MTTLTIMFAIGTVWCICTVISLRRKYKKSKDKQRKRDCWFCDKIIWNRLSCPPDIYADRRFLGIFTISLITKQLFNNEKTYFY